MHSIVGQIFANKALDLGLSVCLHRFDSTVEKRVQMLKDVFTNTKEPNMQKDVFTNAKEPNMQKDRVWLAIGLRDLDNVESFVNNGAENLIIDIANGYLTYLTDYAESIYKKSNKKIKKLMLGNIHSKEMIREYGDLSNRLQIPLYYRCGIASGSVCNTQSMTGYNRGQITELMECAEAAQEYDNLHLVADGGIADPSCAAKAFGAGADAIMMAGYFSHARESQHVIDNIYKFWGGASEFQQILTNGVAERHSEGKEKEINRDDLVPLKKLVSDLFGGIKSAVSYSGYNSLSEFIGNGVFEIKQ